MPFIRPMLARKYCGKLPDRFFTQPKLDGVRAIAAADGLWSRSGRRITSCPHIELALKAVFDGHPDLILDGELYHHDLCDDLFSIISAANRRMPAPAGSAPFLQFHVYDVPSSPASFSERVSILDQLRSFLSGPRSPIGVVETSSASSRDELDAHLKTALADGYEGVMIRSDSQYVQGRTSNLLKLKPFDDDEFDILGFEEVGGAASGFAQRVTLQLPDGRTFKANLKCDRSYARALLNGDFKSATVRHFGLTPNGIPRSPVAVAFYRSPKAAAGRALAVPPII
ncbi:hypothetical protein [Pseudolabrys taiwanensis]|nr:hypothetical protein [Pseudolabrys taiwanensis]